MLAGLALQARRGLPAAASAPYAVAADRALRVLLVVLAVVLLAWRRGAARRAGGAADGWPWPLTDLTARAVGAWLVGLGWAAAHARLIDDVDRVQPLGLTGVAFVVLEAVALVRYGDALDWSSRPAVVYLVLLAGSASRMRILALGAGSRVRAADAAARARTR